MLMQPFFLLFFKNQNLFLKKYKKNQKIHLMIIYIFLILQNLQRLLQNIN